MNVKNMIAAVLVTLVSVALAVGITFIAARGNSPDINIQTPDPNLTAPVSNTLAIGDPIDANITSTSLPIENCTFPVDIWVQYPGAWKIDFYRIGDKTYSKDEIVNILRGNSRDVRGRLLAQIFVAVLNQQNGADATKISSAFSQAIAWLETFPPGSTPSDGDLLKANSITSTLSSYNEGMLGPPACSYELSAVISSSLPDNRRQVTATGSLTASSTPHRIYPTETRSPREDQDRHPTPRIVRPTNRPPPTAVPPSPTPDIPTAVPTAPNPTSPPPPPTAAPTEPPPEEPTLPPVAPTLSDSNPPPTSIPPTEISSNPTSKPSKKTPKPFVSFMDRLFFSASIK